MSELSVIKDNHRKELTPREVVRELDRYIIGQDEAKRAVAIALRNRYRRSQLPEDMREEIFPKNILMIGPTGVGKTEIARRLAKLVDAPFIKVEATKFTEVGYVGRDVESIIRDLMENAIRMVKEEHENRVKTRAQVLAEDRLVTLLVNPPKKNAANNNPLDFILGRTKAEPEPSEAEKSEISRKRDEIRDQLRRGELEDKELEIEVEESAPQLEVGGAAINIGDMMGGMMPKRTKMRHVKVKEARKILIEEEAEKLIDEDAVKEEALQRCEQSGIVFLDEIDKIAGRGGAGHGPDVSREGVQRDILPIVEGSTVNTKYGPVRTDFMLFIGAGAFHVAKVTDLIPELQGRFPVHVNLKSLTQEDFVSILTKTDNAITRQYAALLEVDKVHLTFEEDALNEIARIAMLTNETREDIGARRLHAVFEELLEDVSFNAGGDNMPDVYLSITAQYVKDHLKAAKEMDMRRYIL
ncbi:MAG: ATP-dependent protease ATPase subunit HslU [Clostridia bacterium]|nr:ATP-dependent protease ATPase subunit HslU [Clostridiales bacterium]MBQ6804436.1 ATP-dependent protease ATPase subunit HslU [Clostridia bacterium]MDD6684130.1 ATP-dependent protease ATPase subunit HslU [Clostridiales bacterium]